MTTRIANTRKDAPKSKPRNVGAELETYHSELEKGKAKTWARKTVFVRGNDGALTRTVTTATGKKMSCQTLTAAASARLQSGLSQAQFAALMGVSVRTLQEWEQGRKDPSGAAKTLLSVALLRPEVLRELNGENADIPLTV